MGSEDQSIGKFSEVAKDASSWWPPEAEKGGLSPRLILCEQSGIWAAAMRRAYPQVSRYWRRFPTWWASWEAFRQRPQSFLVVELTSENLSEILNALRWMECFAPGGRLAVLADRRWAGLEWMLREAGIVHWTTSLRAVGPLVEMALGHLKRSARPAATLRERIWRRLPWAKAAQKDTQE